MKDETLVVLAVLAVIIFFWWQKHSRRSNNAVPLGNTIPKTAVPATSSGATGGDSFTSGCGIVSGVCEKSTGVSVAPTAPLITHLPVDPPPLAIQTPPAGLQVAAPKLPVVPTAPVRVAPRPPIITQTETARPVNFGTASYTCFSRAGMPRTTAGLLCRTTAPVAIVKPPAPVTVTRTVAPKPNPYVIPNSGGAPNVNYLDMLANCAAARNTIDVGCGSF